jgi:cyclopropane fatty-acyl-phospholipid synthase-like methyltransferase
LRKQSILKRIVDQKGTLAGITEMDLAEDAVTEVTDQNHIGGVKFVRDLARKAGVGPATDVLDLGCGLGGSARCLAHFFGCRVHGVDLSVERYREARQLTKRVGLNHLVTFQCGDVLHMALPRRRFDVLWGQAAWVHIKDKERFIRKWAKALKAGGRIALEEAYVKRLPQSTTQKRNLDELADHWKSYLVGLDIWTEILSSQSFEVQYKADHSTELSKLCRKLIRLARTRITTEVPESEQKAWKLTVKLVRQGIVGYFRLIGRKLS